MCDASQLLPVRLLLSITIAVGQLDLIMMITIVIAIMIVIVIMVTMIIIILMMILTIYRRSSVLARYLLDCA